MRPASGATAAATAAEAAAEAAARNAYGRLLAWLAWQWRDIAAAEDALSEAFTRALERWPVDGVPASPEGWLMTAARRNLLQSARRRQLAEDPTLTVLFPTEDSAAPPDPELPDDRLRLMFVCAHPAIDPSIHAALMLQTVLGLDAARVARAFVVSPEAMTKRLVRAKAKIRDTAVRFEEPERSDLPERVGAVLEAIYGAYTVDAHSEHALDAGGLAEEALFLAELVCRCLPQDAEARGLLALLLYCEARKAARLDADGALVPLDRQDAGRWDRSRIERADALLASAAALRSTGPLQLEAAIQSAHCSRQRTGRTPWADIRALYDGLLTRHPTIGARIGHAIATAQATDDAATGLRLLDAMDPKSVDGHQPWWAARALLLERLGRTADAVVALRRAIGMTEAPHARRYLLARERALSAARH